MRRAFFAIALTFLGSGLVKAQAFGTAYSGPATGDGAAAYFNPAAMNLADTVLELDLGAAPIRLQFESEVGTTNSSLISPLLTLGMFTDRIHPDIRLGFSLGVPAASGGTWDPDAGAGDVTRWYLVDGTSLHLGGVIAMSWAPVEWLSIGAGAQLVYGQISSRIDKDFGAQLNAMAGCDYEPYPFADPSDNGCPFPYGDPTFAAPIRLSMNGFGVGGTFGVALNFPQFRAGVSVHTPLALPVSGEVSVEYPTELRSAVRDILPSAELPALNALGEASMNLPWSIHVGLTYRPVTELDFALYYRWDQQSVAPYWEVVIIEASSDAIQNTGKAQGYRNRHFARLRVGYQVHDAVNVSLFGSYQSNTVPEETVTPTSLDFHRVEIGLAGNWRINERFSLFLQYGHLFLLRREVRANLHRPSNLASLANFNKVPPLGAWSGAADLVRLGFQVRFDRE